MNVTKGQYRRRAWPIEAWRGIKRLWWRLVVVLREVRKNPEAYRRAQALDPRPGERIPAKDIDYTPPPVFFPDLTPEEQRRVSREISLTIKRLIRDRFGPLETSRNDTRGGSG